MVEGPGRDSASSCTGHTYAISTSFFLTQTFLPSRSLFIMYMQSVSFLYMKPPGYDASLERLEQANRVR